MAALVSRISSAARVCGRPFEGRWGSCGVFGELRSLPDGAQDDPGLPQDGPEQPQDGPGRTQDGPRRPQDSPRRPQDSPKTSQDGARTATERPRTALGRPQDSPRRPQDSPRRPQDDPRRVKTAPGRPQEGLEWPQDGPKKAPKMVPDDSQTVPGRPQDAPLSRFWRVLKHVQTPNKITECCATSLFWWSVEAGRLSWRPKLHLGGFWPQLGGSLEPPGGVLGASGSHLAAVLGRLESVF